MSDDELRTTVEHELVWDPKVDGQAIVVLADHGAVTLRGTVDSLREKREAARAAKRVAGVKALHDRLKVRILDTQRRDDADLRGSVLQALALDSSVPSTIDARARDGAVTLTGWAPPGGGQIGCAGLFILRCPSSSLSPKCRRSASTSSCLRQPSGGISPMRYSGPPGARR